MKLLLLIYLLAISFLPVKAQDYTVVPVLSTQSFYLNGGSRSMMGGKSRIMLPITLPPNTVEWYYSFAAFRNPTEAESSRQAYSLFTQLVGFVDQSGIASLAARLSQPTGAEVCDVYLLDADNVDRFLSKADHNLAAAGGGFRYFLEGYRGNFTAGAVPIKTAALQQGTFYLGIKNPSVMTGIHVNVEVHAVVKKE